ncbi:MAG: hypothetical protein HY553_05570 [Elusimicrobia bacterium]|nr:hypothetical protein [Elusimicrobiota bacterium]
MIAEALLALALAGPSFAQADGEPYAFLSLRLDHFPEPIRRPRGPSR